MAKNNVMGLIGFIGSLVGLVLFMFPYFGIVFSITGIVLGSLQAKRGQTGMGIAGLVIGIIGTVLNAFLLLLVIIILGMAL